MTRLLIAVLSCQRDRILGHHETIRRRWGNALYDVSDVRFFVGGSKPNDLLGDEVWLDVLDDYQSSTFKMRAICIWALHNNYDFIFKCDCDTTIFIKRFKTCGYENFDYTGRFHGGGPKIKGSAAAGGGYFVSKKAYEIIASHYDPNSTMLEEQVTADVLYPYIASGEIKALHLEMSIYAAARGLGEIREAAPAYEAIKRKIGEL